MCIANLGKAFARLFRILYHTCCCGICCICCLAYRRKKVAEKLAKEGDSAKDIDLSVLGNGKPLSISNDPNCKPGVRETMHHRFTKAQVWLINVKKKFSHSMRDDVTVPVYLCLVVMAGYIMSGALLFAIYDKWTYLEGAYFCFVTLSTIGFGDYVPGIVSGGNTSESSSTERLVICTLYVFVGLALIGMCFDLMQADVLLKLRWIAAKIGAIGKNEDDFPEEDKVEKKVGSHKNNSKYSVEAEHLLTVDIEHSLPASPDVNVHKKVHYQQDPVAEKLNSNSLKQNKRKKEKKPSIKRQQSSSDTSVDLKNEVMKKAGSKVKGLNKQPAQKTSSRRAVITKRSSGSSSEADTIKVDAQAELEIADAKTKRLEKKVNEEAMKSTFPQPIETEISPVPPPSYNSLETVTCAVNAPDAPGSYYDDLPSRITTTPLHIRLNALDSPDHTTVDILPEPPEQYSVGRSREFYPPPASREISPTHSDLLDRILSDAAVTSDKQKPNHRRINLFMDDESDDIS